MTKRSTPSALEDEFFDKDVREGMVQAGKKGSSGVLKAARASDEKVIKGKVVGEKEAMLKGAVGWSYQIESPEPEGPMARVRSYVVGTRLYQIIVVAPKTKFPTADSERFLSSSKLQARN